MRAVRLHAAGGDLRVEDVPAPEPRGTEVRIRVGGCGVCRTDLHIVDGTQPRVELPRTLGHEVAGWLDTWGPEAGALLSDAGITAGDAVLVSGGWGCGACRDCAAGDEQRCAGSRAPGFQADGGYAEAMLVPHPRHLVPLRTLDPVRACVLADAGVTPYRAVRRAEPWLTPGARVLLIGCGALGGFALQYLRLLPDLTVAVRELSSDRLERAKALGADTGLLADDPDWQADVIFDFVGTDATLAQTAASVTPGGLVLLVGEAGGSLRFGFDQPPVESWLTTVAWGSDSDLREVVAMAEDGALRWEVETMPLNNAAAAHSRLRAGHMDGRIVILP